MAATITMQFAHRNTDKKRKFVTETNNMIKTLLKCEPSWEDSHFSMMWAFTRALFLKDYLEGMHFTSEIFQKIYYFLKESRLNQIGVLNYHVEEGHPTLSDVVELTIAANVWNFKNSIISR